MLVGTLYASLMTLFSPWLFHFIPVVVLLHGLMYGVAFGFFGHLVERLEGKKYWTALIILLIGVGVHLEFWFMYYSTLIYNKNVVHFPLSLAIVLLSIIFFGWLTRQLLHRSNLSFVYLIVSILIVFGVRDLGVRSIPTDWLVKVKIPPLQYKHYDSKEYTRLRAYPLSVPVHQGLALYNFLIPSPDTEKAIVVLLLDAFREDYVGKQVYGESVTPTIDSFINERAIYFDQYRVQSTWTKPSTASFFTGRYPRNHGSLYGGGDQERYTGNVLPEKFNTLAERLAEKGFRNFGVTMTSHMSPRYQFDQGFHLWLSPHKGYGTVPGQKIIQSGDFHSLNQFAFWLLRESPEKSFVYLHLFGPHQPFSLSYQNKSFWKRVPYNKDDELKIDSRFSFRTTNRVESFKDGTIQPTPEEIAFLEDLYAAKLNFIDRRLISPFLATVDNLGIHEDSFLTITGDHGEELFDHDSYAHGNNLYETTLHVPLVVDAPEANSSLGFDRTVLVDSHDLGKTYLDYAQAGTDRYQGVSFLPLLQNERPGESQFRRTFSEHPEKNHIESASVVEYPWKLIHHYTQNSSELYNLEDDPGEQDPLDKPSKRRDLRELIFSELGSDSGTSIPSVSLKEATEAEKENLEGLGYIH